MSKPVQILEPAVHFSPDAAGVANKGPREDGESSFSSILSRSKSDPASTESGRVLHASGRKLPGQQESRDDHHYADDASPPARVPTDASGRPDAIEEPLSVNDPDLAEQMAVQTSLQQALVPDERALETAGLAEATDVAGQPVNADELALARAAGQQLQDQLAEVPGNLPVLNEQVVEDAVQDLREARGVPAAYLTTADTGRMAPEVEPVANAVREAVQSAIANQTSSRDLKQFLQQNPNQQAAGNSLSVADAVETETIPFLQTLSDKALLMPSSRISVPVGQPGWGQAVGTQVAWFVSQNISAASLRLNPQHLGPLEMQVSLDGDQASVSFTSQQGLVRDALESSVPRLREMLSENGLTLVNVNVSQQGKSHRDGQDAADSRDEAGVANAEGGSNEPAPGSGMRQNIALTQGLVDFYA
jgi:flagellar hook-length control protein FliK